MHRASSNRSFLTFVEFYDQHLLFMKLLWSLVQHQLVVRCCWCCFFRCIYAYLWVVTRCASCVRNIEVYIKTKWKPDYHALTAFPTCDKKQAHTQWENEINEPRNQLEIINLSQSYLLFALHFQHRFFDHQPRNRDTDDQSIAIEPIYPTLSSVCVCVCFCINICVTCAVNHHGMAGYSGSSSICSTLTFLCLRIFLCRWFVRKWVKIRNGM